MLFRSFESYYVDFLSQLKLLCQKNEIPIIDKYISDKKYKNIILTFSNYIHENDLFDSFLLQDDSIIANSHINSILCNNVDLYKIFTNPDLSLNSFNNLWSFLFMFYILTESSKDNKNDKILLQLYNKLNIDVDNIYKLSFMDKPINNTLGEIYNSPNNDFFLQFKNLWKLDNLSDPEQIKIFKNNIKLMYKNNIDDDLVDLISDILIHNLSFSDLIDMDISKQLIDKFSLLLS